MFLSLEMNSFGLEIVRLPLGGISARNVLLYIFDAARNSTGIDATAGNFPRYTQVIGNLIHEIGLQAISDIVLLLIFLYSGQYEKQSSGWFQALSAQTTLRYNIIFNGPR